MNQHFAGVRPGIGEKGFSLVEVLFAMVILAFGVLGVMGMFQWADHGLRHGANGTRALAMVDRVWVCACAVIPQSDRLTVRVSVDVVNGSCGA